MDFTKYHALGNDYLVLDSRYYPELPETADMATICNRHYALGADGILYGPLPSKIANFKLRIFNSDGTEAEKSGNGLRIFARYLWNQDLVNERPFTVETLGGIVTCKIHDYDERISVNMGQATFYNKQQPTDKPELESIEVNGKVYQFYSVSVGNPHCIIPVNVVSADLMREIGPVIENHPFFPKRTNVQLLQVFDKSNIKLEIWERGSGYTLASGSCSSAAAALAHKIGLCHALVNVHMPGGQLHVELDEDNSIQITGPVTRIGYFELHPEVLSQDIPCLS